MSLGLPVVKRNALFKFLNCWASLEGFQGVVEEGWQVQVRGFPQFVLAQKLKATKKKLKNFHRNRVGNLEEGIKKARLRLEVCQTQLSMDYSNVQLRLKEESLISVLQEKLHCEELCLKQRSRVQWLTEGDLNTAFFHISIQQRRNAKYISSLTLESGSVISAPADIRDEVIRHFESILGHHRPPCALP